MPHSAFITNIGDKTLKNRLKQLIEHSKTLKFLVGFFYFSGFSQLYETLKGNPGVEIRILVGLDIDKQLFETVEVCRQMQELSGDDKADLFF